MNSTPTHTADWRRALLWGGAVAALLGLPLIGARIAGRPVATYLEFPPLTRYVEHAGFAWPAFIAMAIGILAVVLPFDLTTWRQRKHMRLEHPAQAMPFPWWAWCGLAVTLLTWMVAWTRIPAFSAIQLFTFSPLWLGYILVMNGLAYRRTGRCLMLNHPLYFTLLFPVSAVFWWYFEYLNRFVQNWYYIGCENFTPAEYIIFATLPFSTVLPAVMSTADWLAGHPQVGAGLTDGIPVRPRRPRLWASLVLGIACAGLAGIAVWPDILFPLLWVSPLLVITSLQALAGHITIWHDLRSGNWRRLYRLAAAALICGGCWELWNLYSAAKWVYVVPYVGQFRIFEMPVLGYAGYLPFGLECAVIADAVWRASQSVRAPEPGHEQDDDGKHLQSPDNH